MRILLSFCLCLVGLTTLVKAQSTPENDLKLYMIDCGSIHFADLDPFSTEGDYAGTSSTFAATCYLIRHKDGDLLWDIGLPLPLLGNEPKADDSMTPILKETIVDQLARINVTPDDIEYLSISHSDWDHTGQITHFTSPTWLVSKKEHDYMFSTDESAAYNAAFKGLNKQIFEKDYDVFGDGSVMILATPGHTPGHTVLQVMLEETGPVLISGDLYHQAKSRELKRVPRFNFDKSQTEESMKRFEATANELNAKVIIQHEQIDIDQIPKIPAYLK
ncbi:MAG: N-acyl homoserine lactonase family protein [Emcibacteraceae bacterium]|nr:N-acyl homoserine lactonase family protein [Emcibacteraceae bacterium]